MITEENLEKMNQVLGSILDALWTRVEGKNLGDDHSGDLIRLERALAEQLIVAMAVREDVAQGDVVQGLMAMWGKS